MINLCSCSMYWTEGSAPNPREDNVQKDTGNVDRSKEQKDLYSSVGLEEEKDSIGTDSFDILLRKNNVVNSGTNTNTQEEEFALEQTSVSSDSKNTSKQKTPEDIAFEEEFGIEIPDEAAEKITTVEKAVDYITQNS